MPAKKLLWPDDVIVPSSRDGLEARLGGNERYFVSGSLLSAMPDLLTKHRTALTRYILDNAGEDPVELMTWNIKQILRQPPVPMKQKFDRLLRTLVRSASSHHSRLFISEAEEPHGLMRLTGVSSVAELRTLLHHAAQEKLLDLEFSTSGTRVSVNLRAFFYVEDLERPNAESTSGFVAMWFSSEMSPAYTDGIRPAIEENGYTAVRIDDREHNNKIDDEIISEIRRARFVVADFSCGDTGARGGVYFEAGFALGLGIPVIWCVRSSDLERVHFDTRQFNHIVWDDPEDLRNKLRHRIGATIGQAVAPPSS